jgi:hypothetical protein
MKNNSRDRDTQDPPSTSPSPVLMPPSAITSLYGRLRIVLRQVVLDNYPAGSGPSRRAVGPVLYGHVQVGHHRHVTPRFRANLEPSTTLSSDGDDVSLEYLAEGDTKNPPSPYVFQVSYHGHLFWSVIIDVFQERTLLGPTHVGRSELHLHGLPSAPASYTAWLELRQGRLGLVPELTELLAYKSSSPPLPPSSPLSLSSIEEDAVIGQVQVQLSYSVMSEKPLPDIPPIPNEDAKVDGREDEEGTDLQRVLDEARERIGEIADEQTRDDPDLSDRSPSLLNASSASMSTDSSSSSYNVETMTMSSPSSSTKDVMMEEGVQVNDAVPSSSMTSSLWGKLASLVLSAKDLEALRAVQSITAGFQQRLRLSNLALTQGYVYLMRHYNEQPIPLYREQIMRHLDAERLALARRLYRHSEATMGWLGLQYVGKRPPLTLMGDVFRPRADLQAVLQYLNMRPEHMLVFSLGREEQEALRPNFYVCHDPALNAIVLAIRGTMSLRDLLTDLVCEYVPWRSGYVHAGILAAARWFLRHVCPQLRLFQRDLGARHVYFTGHSLGGAVASLTCLLYMEHLCYLDDDGRSPDNVDKGQDADDDIVDGGHCFAFGPPPVVSHALHRLHQRHIDTFVNGDDFVPRLSYGTACDLQQLVALAAALQRHRKPADLSALVDKARHKLQATAVHPKLYLLGRVHHLLRIRVPASALHRSASRDNNSKHKGDGPDNADINRSGKKDQGDSKQGKVEGGDDIVKRTVVDCCEADDFGELCAVRKNFRHHLPDAYDRSLQCAEQTWHDFEHDADALLQAIVSEAPRASRHHWRPIRKAQCRRRCTGDDLV